LKSDWLEVRAEILEETEVVKIIDESQISKKKRKKRKLAKLLLVIIHDTVILNWFEFFY